MDKRERRNTEVEIDIIPLMKALLSKVWLMVIVGIVIAGLAFGAAKVLVKPTYRSGFTAYVNNQQTQVNKDVLTSSDLTAAKELVRTYSQILKSNSVLTASANSISMNYSYTDLKDMVFTEIENDTEIIDVYVVHTDPRVAYDLANAIAATSPTYMAKIVEGSSMKVIDVPLYSEQRYKPSYAKFALLGFLAGVLLIMIIYVIKYFSDDTVKSEGDIESRFDIPILGVIPDLTKSDDKKSNYYAYDYSSESAQRNHRRSVKNEK